MAIPFLNHLDLRSVSELQNAILHKTTSATASDVEGKIIYDTGSDTIKYYNGSTWINLDGSGDIAGVTAGTYLNGGGTSGTVTLNHDTTSRTNPTSTASPAFGTDIDVIDTVTTNATGHVTSVNTKTITLPTPSYYTDSDVDAHLNTSTATTSQVLSWTGTDYDWVTPTTGDITRVTGNGGLTGDTTSGDATVSLRGNASFTDNTILKWDDSEAALANSSITDDGTTVTIYANLDVEGTTTTIDSTTVAIGDNMMKYAKDNTANASDIGWYGVINDGTEKYSGMWYDASTGTSAPKFALGIATTEPAGTGTIAVTGTLVADLEGNADTATTLETAQDFSITGDVSANAVSFNGSANVELDVNIDENVVGAAELKVSSNGTSGQVLVSDGDGTFSWANAGTDTQLATAAALIDVSVMAGNSTASFTHSLGSKNLIVQLYDTTSGEVVHADIDHTSNNAISITFALTGTELVAEGIGDIRVVVIDAKNGLTDKTVSYS